MKSVSQKKITGRRVRNAVQEWGRLDLYSAEGTGPSGISAQSADG